MAYTKNKMPLLWLAGGLLLSIVVLFVIFGGFAGEILVTDTEGIFQAADEVMVSVQKGDWDTLGQLVSGRAELAPETGADGSAENRIWNAYRESLSWQVSDTFTIKGEAAVLNITISYMDINSITGSMAEIMKDLGNGAENHTDALAAAAQQALESNVPTAVRECTMGFVREDGAWLLIPDNTLLALLSGFMAP